MKRVSEATGATNTRFLTSNLTEKTYSRLIDGNEVKIKIVDGIKAGSQHGPIDGPAWRQSTLEPDQSGFKARIRKTIEAEAERRRVKAEKIEAQLKAENSKRKRLAEAEAEADRLQAARVKAQVVDSRPNPFEDARVDRILRNRDKRKALKAKGITGIRRDGKTTRLIQPRGIGASKTEYKQALRNAKATVEFEGRQPSDNLMPSKGRIWGVEKNGHLIKDHQNPKARDLPVRPQHLS